MPPPRTIRAQPEAALGSVVFQSPKKPLLSGILAPFPDIAAHVVKPPRVRLLAPNRMGCLSRVVGIPGFVAQVWLSLAMPARQAYSHSASDGSR